MDNLLQITRIIVVGITLLCSCYLTGSLVNKKWEIESGRGIFQRFSSICILGWLIQMAVFQVICVPMVIWNVRFSQLVLIYLILITILSIVSIFVCRKKDLILSVNSVEKKKFSVYRMVAILLIVLQVISFVFMWQVSEDGIMDYTLVAQTIKHDTMFRTYPYTGYDCTLLYFTPRFINGWYMYRAFLVKITTIHPTIVGRTILPPISVILSYLCYYRLGSYLLKDDKKTDTFMIFLSIINIFGYLRMTPMTSLMTDAVNGKTIFVDILLPLIFLSLLKLYENVNDKKQYLFLMLLNICAVAMSTTALVYAALVTVLITGIIAHKRKKVGMLLYAFLSIMPNVVYFLLYFLEKELKLWI